MKQRPETKDKREGTRDVGEGDEMFILRDKRLSLVIEKINMAHRQMAVFPIFPKGKLGETPC